MTKTDEAVNSNVANAIRNYIKSVQRESDCTFRVIRRVDPALAELLIRYASRFTNDMSALFDAVIKNGVDSPQAKAAAFGCKESHIKRITHLLTERSRAEKSLTAKAKDMKKRGLSSEKAAQELLKQGGYDADHVGEVLTKVYKLKECSANILRSASKSGCTVLRTARVFR